MWKCLKFRAIMLEEAFEDNSICTLPSMQYFSRSLVDILHIYNNLTCAGHFGFMFHELHTAIPENTSILEKIEIARYACPAYPCWTDTILTSNDLLVLFLFIVVGHRNINL